MGSGSDREAESDALRRSLEEFRLAIEADPLLPSAEMRRRLDAVADEFLDLFGAEVDAARTA